jgi:hypothetical protein
MIQVLALITSKTPQPTLTHQMEKALVCISFNSSSPEFPLLIILQLHLALVFGQNTIQKCKNQRINFLYVFRLVLDFVSFLSLSNIIIIHVFIIVTVSIRMLHFNNPHRIHRSSQPPTHQSPRGLQSIYVAIV